jgi:VWFA-related protein
LASDALGSDLVAVYTLDLALHTVERPTRDRARIKAALERAVSTGNTALASSVAREAVRLQIDAMANADAALSAAAQSIGVRGQGAKETSAQAGQTAIVKATGAMEARLQRNLEALERMQQGHATISGLEAVVESLAAAPGRKTVLLFSEGLAIPANVEPAFVSLVARANEANVSIYAMDAGGLRVASPTDETARELRQAGERRLRQIAGAGDPGLDGSLMRQLERDEDLLRLDPRSGLGQLAEGTGAFLIRDTNDAAAALRRVEEDMRFHYVLSYAPSNESFDGRFRRVDVRVRRRGVSVQARQGYVARPRAYSEMR